MSSLENKKVLLLGSGFVAKPTLDVLDEAGVEVTVACRTLAAAQDLAKGAQHASAVSLDVSDDAALDAAVAKVDLVVSLIPYTFHATVIKSAIRNKKHVVTTSYVSPAMLELDAAAKEAGITVMNEIGVDPGVDHLYAIKTIHEVHQAGGKVVGFYSFCGGLPAPEASDNPLGYKMSWSPRGVLLALRNTARIIKDGKHVEIDGKDLMGTAKPYYIYPAFAFVGYPNRDSTVYPERYGIPEARNVVRGTLRYQGFPEMIRTLVDTGFLSDEPRAFLSADSGAGAASSWREATRQVLGAQSSAEADLVAAVVGKTSFKDAEEQQQVLNGLRWMGLFSDEPVDPRGNPLDTLCATLARKMAYGPDERDMVMLQHKFEIENADGSSETRTSTLVEYGDPKGYSAMARLVGVPCAVAVQQVFDGTISEEGILAPMTEEICAPLRKTLEEKYGIRMIEKTLQQARSPCILEGTALKFPAISRCEDQYAPRGRAPASPRLSLFACCPRALRPARGGRGRAWLDVPVLERHPYTTQTFVPMALSPARDAETYYLVVVAPTLAGEEAVAATPAGQTVTVRDPPDLARAQAFVAHGGQGVTYAPGTWHAPMAVIGADRVDFAVMQFANGVADDDCQEVALAAPLAVEAETKHPKLWSARAAVGAGSRPGTAKL
ncbi:Saccharopine dehydrogenase [NADP(+), L-glutamate-forming] [Ascosphaera acerosa]|nr:Saccharopine dehydrogenase [NADP(+), L-glutamate-forming] [Ascosphaera acerosa]